MEIAVVSPELDIRSGGGEVQQEGEVSDGVVVPSPHCSKDDQMVGPALALTEAKCLGEVVGLLFRLWMEAVGETARQRLRNTVEIAHDGIWLA